MATLFALRHVMMLGQADFFQKRMTTRYIQNLIIGTSRPETQKRNREYMKLHNVLSTR